MELFHLQFFSSTPSMDRSPSVKLRGKQWSDVSTTEHHCVCYCNAIMKKSILCNENPTPSTCTFENAIQCVLAKCLPLLYSRCKYLKKHRRKKPVHIHVKVTHDNLQIENLNLILCQVNDRPSSHEKTSWNCCWAQGQTTPHCCFLYQLLSMLGVVFGNWLAGFHWQWHLTFSVIEICGQLNLGIATTGQMQLQHYQDMNIIL